MSRIPEGCGNLFIHTADVFFSMIFCSCIIFVIIIIIFEAGYVEMFAVFDHNASS